MIIKFQDTIPPLADEEFRQLEQNILADGIRDPLTVWGDVLIDGHNRYKIALKHDLPYTTKQIDFDSEAAAEVWIIKTQFGRRNLSAYQRSVLSLRLKPLLAERAKERMVAGKRHSDPKPNLAEGIGQTRDELAELAGVGHTTVNKVAYIQEHGTDEIKAQLQNGEISIHKAYGETTSSIPPMQRGRPAKITEQKQPTTEKVCSICGRLLPIDHFYPNGKTIKAHCKQCAGLLKKGGNSPDIKDNIRMIEDISNSLTDTERVIEYSIEDIIAIITAEIARFIRIVNTETQNHADLMKDPGNKEALQKALDHGVSQIRDTIKNLAR